MRMGTLDAYRQQSVREVSSIQGSLQLLRRQLEQVSRNGALDADQKSALMDGITVKMEQYGSQLSRVGAQLGQTAAQPGRTQSQSSEREAAPQTQAAPSWVSRQSIIDVLV